MRNLLSARDLRRKKKEYKEIRQIYFAFETSSEPKLLPLIDLIRTSCCSNENTDSYFFRARVSNYHLKWTNLSFLNAFKYSNF